MPDNCMISGSERTFQGEVRGCGGSGPGQIGAAANTKPQAPTAIRLV
jgi:hypothetical protein